MEVIIYSTESCPNCKRAKDYFDTRNISYIEKMVDRDKSALKELKKKGHIGVPIIYIDGEEIIGFDREKIEGFFD